jgi:hypothetical protein
MKHTQEKVIPVSKIKTPYVLLVLFACVIIGCFPFVTIALGLSLGWVKFIQMLLFLGAGFVYSFKIQRKDPFLPTVDNQDRNSSIWLAIFTCSALAIIYFIFNRHLILMALGSASAFLLPGIGKNSWEALKDYAGTEYGVWMKPLPDTRERTFIFFGGLGNFIKQNSGV